MEKNNHIERNDHIASFTEIETYINQNQERLHRLIEEIIDLCAKKGKDISQKKSFQEEYREITGNGINAIELAAIQKMITDRSIYKEKRIISDKIEKIIGK